jgi:hypothetical protein
VNALRAGRYRDPIMARQDEYLLRPEPAITGKKGAESVAKPALRQNFSASGVTQEQLQIGPVPAPPPSDRRHDPADNPAPASARRRDSEFGGNGSEDLADLAFSEGDEQLLLVAEILIERTEC